MARVGIKEGQMSFTFNADSTFTAKVGAKSIKGTYSYDASTQNASLKFMKLIPLNAKINCTSANMDLLFNSDKLLKLITLISSKSNNSTLKTIGSLANSYDGMMLGFTLRKGINAETKKTPQAEKLAGISTPSSLTKHKKERKTRLELATLTLARLCSTN